VHIARKGDRAAESPGAELGKVTDETGERSLFAR
jgi:hypothetical protein